MLIRDPFFVRAVFTRNNDKSGLAVAGAKQLYGKLDVDSTIALACNVVLVLCSVAEKYEDESILEHMF